MGVYGFSNKLLGFISILIIVLQAAYREQIREKAKDGNLKAVNGSAVIDVPKKRRRWDQTAEPEPAAKQSKKDSSWDGAETPGQNRWDDTPGRAKGADTPGATPSTRMWDATPGHATPGATTPGRETPGTAALTPSARKNRWDETPRTERGEKFFHCHKFPVN